MTGRPPEADIDRAPAQRPEEWIAEFPSAHGNDRFPQAVRPLADDATLEADIWLKAWVGP